MIHERPLTQLLALVLLAAASGCSPPPELTAPQEALVRRCLELAHKQETDSACAEGVSEPMKEAFLLKHPDFYEQLLAERKKLVEDRIAEDKRRHDELNLCVDDREAGNTQSPSCEKFMAHEITREIEDRRRTRCASATLDGKADAPQRCEGLSKQEVAEEAQMERVRRERRR